MGPAIPDPDLEMLNRPEDSRRRLICSSHTILLAPNHDGQTKPINFRILLA